MGRYRPPSTLDPALSEAPRNPHARASSSTTTTWSKPEKPTVRFETPFATWCTTCSSTSTSALIGQGTRFNAYKSRVGTYFSTPIFSLRFRHPACGGWIEFRTDPAAAARDAEGGRTSGFVVVEGGRKRDYGGGDDGDDGTVTLVPADREGGLSAERKRQRDDAFARVEGKAAERVQIRDGAERIRELQRCSHEFWRDPHEVNRRLRADFRHARKERERKMEDAQRVKDKYGLGVDVVEEETETDGRLAATVGFTGRKREGLRDIVKKSERDKADPFLGVANGFTKRRRRMDRGEAGGGGGKYSKDNAMNDDEAFW